jgi:hypothetical protein
MKAELTHNEWRCLDDLLAAIACGDWAKAEFLAEKLREMFERS